MILSSFLYDFISLFYPKYCLACEKNLNNSNNLLCFNCLEELPLTNYSNLENNPVNQLFWGKVDIKYAIAHFTFYKGSKYQNMIHSFKYQGYKELGELLGNMLGVRILELSNHYPPEIIIPVPLHPKKYKKRGYNQSEWIAKGIAKAFNCQIDTKSLIRIKHTDSQTHKTRTERWENVKEIFWCDKTCLLEGKHILIVDDIITTGATLEACANALLKTHNNITISVAGLAVARI